ncbi:response regulator [Methylobacillus caricis]|uniref:response regulator n=1 Tax=Methylobacillus caricis TaxID=1971611 RepID=UPI001CFF8A16|nr:response regulator [Methylobacillus caricis]MCB5189050.1 response regulator [Methylobacillus caricis]
MNTKTNKTILLVEDNPDDEELTLLAFEQNNIFNTITVARDGVEALDLLFGPDNQGGSVDPSIVLLDLKLPRIDGLEVLRRIRGNARTKFLPVVILTSSREEQDLIDSYSLGCNSYVRKPVNFAEFLEAVRQLGLYWLLLNEMPSGGRAP